MNRACAIPFLAALAACGDPKDSGITVEHGAPTAAALTTVPENAGSFLGLPAAIFNPSCLSASTGTFDTDGDGLPDVATYNLDCTTTQNAASVRVTGTTVVLDQNPAGASFRFQATYNLTAVAHDTGGAELARSTLSLYVTATEGGGTFDLETDGNQNTTLASGVQLTEKHSWQALYTPTGAWALGDPLVDGSMFLSGAWKVTISGDTVSTVLNGTLQVDNSCAPTSVSSGSIDAIAASGSSFSNLSATWTGCGNVGATMDGVAVDLTGSQLPIFAL